MLYRKHVHPDPKEAVKVVIRDSKSGKDLFEIVDLQGKKRSEVAKELLAELKSDRKTIVFDEKKVGSVRKMLDVSLQKRVANS